MWQIIRRVIQKVVKREKFRLTITRERGEIDREERERKRGERVLLNLAQKVFYLFSHCPFLT